MKKVMDYIVGIVNNTPLQQDRAKPFNRKEIIFVLTTAVFIITICSKSSPIYPFNDWVDSNCFFTVGKSMLYGKVPYRDLFEQKGPLLYMLHAAAALVSGKTFLGVYFIEIIACFAFLFFALKIIRLYYESASILLIPILSVLVYTAPSFCHGDSAEELCLPFYAFAIYIGLKSLHQKIPPTKVESFAVGVTAACVLWIKFSLLGIYIGWIAVLAIMLIKEKKAKELFKTVIIIAAGVLVLSLPILIYFILNNSLEYLWTVYFYDNIFHYSKGSNSTFVVSLANNLYGGINNMFKHNIVPTIVALLAFPLLVLPKKKQKLDFWFLMATFLGCFLLVYVGGRKYTYYSHILSAFAPFGVALAWGFAEKPILRFKEKSSKITRTGACGLVAVLCAVMAFVLCKNTYLLSYKKDELPQYKFAKVILQVEDATLLNYGVLDSGFYTTTGIVPNTRYFCELNIEIDEMMQTQNDIVQNGRVDFVVTRDEEIISVYYECAEETTMYFEDKDRIYRLYRLVK